MKIACPKCGFEEPESARECSRCGVVFGKLGRPSPDAPRHQSPVPGPQSVGPTGDRGLGTDADDVPDGRIGPAELKVLGIGLVAAIIVSVTPLISFIFSGIITLFHELGHAVMGWILGMPSIPSFDFVYGGGLTHHSGFQIIVALLIAGAFPYGMYLFRQNRKAVVLIGTLFLIWLFFVSSEWRRDFLFSAAGHLAEFILAGILFYQALSGVGWRIPEIERPLGAFVAFFVQINSMKFAWRLMHDAEFLSWYREGKGGMLMNDLESVALDLHIHTPFNPGIIGVARLLFIFSFVPIAVALIWYFQRSRWHRVLRSLRTVDA